MDMDIVFDWWIKGKSIDYKLNEYNLSQAESFFTERARKIYEEAESSEDKAFADLLQLVAFINTVSFKKPDILGKLAEIVAELKRALKKIAEKKIADSYSISAGFPLGVSVGLTWDTTATDGTDA